MSNVSFWSLIVGSLPVPLDLRSFGRGTAQPRVGRSVHSIVSWDFAVTIQPRWHSTIFAPYFVIGAVYSGLAALASILVIVRRSMRLQEFLRAEHFDSLGKLVLVAGMAWVYFWFAGFIVEWYGNEPVVRELIHEEVTGRMAAFFYLQMGANTIPIALLVFKRIRTSPGLLLATTLLINIGMFTERALIVIGSLQRNDLPFNWGNYSPTWVEISIVAILRTHQSLATSLT